mgnify:CR=1 FL=1
MTTTTTEGSNVTFHYTGTFPDSGEEFDSSRKEDRGPMTVNVGAGELIPGFDTALVGMSEGETKTFTVPANEAYGERDDNAIVELERNIFPDDFQFSLGEVVPLTGPGGSPFLATVIKIEDETITTDMNHPLAGKDLNFEIEILTINDTTAENSENENTDG